MQCCRSGYGIQCLFDPWIQNPGSGIGFFRIPDLGSRIPNPYFWELSDKFLGKNFYNSLKISPNFFLQHFKNKIIYNFVKFVATEKRFHKKIFTPPFVAVFRSGIQDQGSRIRINIRNIRDLESGIYISDAQNCFMQMLWLRICTLIHLKNINIFTTFSTFNHHSF